MNLKTQLLLTAIIAAIAFYIGVRYSPASETKTETVERETVKHDTVTVIKEIERPDGTKEKQTTVVDKSKEHKQVDSTVLVSVTAPLPLNRLGLSAHTTDFHEPQSYTLSYERRVLGSVWLGVNYNTRQIYGVSVAMEF